MSVIKVRNWDRFQHYKERNPPWVKYHVSTLDDYELTSLSIPSQLVADRLLLVASTTDNAIPKDIPWISHRVHLPEPVVEQGIQDLMNIGFLVLAGRLRGASTPLAECLSQAETETETETPLVKAPQMRRPDELWDALVKEVGAPSTKSERGKRNAALKELREAGATPEDIKERAAAYRKIWPNIPLTDRGLAGNWTLFGVTPNGPTHKCPECGLGFKGDRTLGLHRERVHGVTV